MMGLFLMALGLLIFLTKKDFYHPNTYNFKYIKDLNVKSKTIIGKVESIDRQFCAV